MMVEAFEQQIDDLARAKAKQLNPETLVEALPLLDTFCFLTHFLNPLCIHGADGSIPACKR